MGQFKLAKQEQTTLYSARKAYAGLYIKRDQQILVSKQMVSACAFDPTRLLVVLSES